MRGSVQKVAFHWLTAFLRLADVSQRLLNRLMADGQAFGNISAYRGDQPLSKNKEDMRLLRSELERRGYKPISTYATWADDNTGETYGERSFLVPDARPEDMFELGQRFKQDSVIYKSSEGSLGMYYTGERPRALLAQDSEGRPAFEIQTMKPPKKEKGPGPRRKEREDEELFSRSRGLNFSFEFDWGTEYPWDGKTPLDKAGQPDPTDLGKKQPQKDPAPKADTTGWDAYLAKHWEGGKRKVPNTNPATKDRFPKVQMSTLLKTDPKFRARVRKDYQRRRDQERGQAREQAAAG